VEIESVLLRRYSTIVGRPCCDAQCADELLEYGQYNVRRYIDLGYLPGSWRACSRELLTREGKERRNSDFDPTPMSAKQKGELNVTHKQV
jgi:hypothetical protein